MNQGARRVADSQAGAMAVTIAIFLVGFLAMVALVFDFGHVVWVKNELQKAADAGSLSGARCLWPYVGVPSTPNWTAAQTAATQTVLLNRADGQLLTNCDLQSGYWNLATKTLESTGVVPTASHLPGIRVTVSKAPGHNGGPVALMFAAFFGLVPQNLTAQATAVITGPATIPPRGGAFPMAVPKVMVEQYWNREPPVSFRIGSAYTDPEGGQWTSFFADANDVPTIRELMAQGNPEPLKIGDPIWLEPGTKTTLYSDAAAMAGQTVILPVVSTDFATHATTPIVGFVSYYIESASGGSDKYIQGHFVKRELPQATSGGPVFGSVVPSTKLVN
jgi:hypothetical protein